MMLIGAKACHTTFVVWGLLDVVAHMLGWLDSNLGCKAVKDVV